MHPPIVLTRIEIRHICVIIYASQGEAQRSLAIHLGGWGDLSQPDPVLVREALITNDVMSTSDVAALKANVVAFYPSLTFP